MQPALNLPGSYANPGYSFRFFGGDATYVIIPNEVMQQGCLLPYSGEAFYSASLSEPYSCVIGAFRACYHVERGSYEHAMGVRPGGTLALLGAAGPMGLAATDYAVHMENKPRRIVATDIDPVRLERARRILSPEHAAQEGVELIYVNPDELDDQAAELRKMNGGKGFDDVFCFVPSSELIEQGDALLAEGGCLNFFAGPTDVEFRAPMNFYRVHYEGTHIVGTSGGNIDDMRTAVEMTEKGRLHPELLVTHIGGLGCVAETTLNMPNIGGGKKLIYTWTDLELTALDRLGELAEKDARFAAVARAVEENAGVWSARAERELLAIYEKE